jgi:hypothetical protein
VSIHTCISQWFKKYSYLIMLMICSITEHKRMKYAPLKKNLVINSVLNYWDKHIGIWAAGLTIS